MKLLVIVLCLYSEYALMHAYSMKREAHWTWYLNKMLGLISKQDVLMKPFILLPLLVLPLVLVVGVVNYLVCGIFYGFIGLLIQIAVFFYCLGPQNPFYPVIDENDKGNAQAALYFVHINRSLFTVMTIYIIFGPLGILVYRAIERSTSIAAVSGMATKLTDLIEYIPARITALLYLLVGNFQRGLVSLTKYLLTAPANNSELLKDCALSAATVKDDETITIVFAESLVTHATIVYLVFLAFLTLVAWM